MTIEPKEAHRLVDEGSKLSCHERMKLQQDRLKELVNYVKVNSPFFRKLYKDLPEDFNLKDLPATNKSELLAHYDEWVTDSDLTKEKVLKYLDRNIDDTSLLLGKYTALKTSGSTGNPLPMVRDDNHNNIHGALMAKRLLKGLDPDMLNPSCHKIATVIHTSPGASSYNGYLRTLAAYPEHADNMMAISVLESIDSIVKKLNDFQPEVLTGYASSLQLLALEKENGNLDIPVKLICNSAELLTEDGYKRLKKGFGCEVINNYCMTEGGEIAMANGGPELLLNDDWIIVEPVDAEMNPVKDPSEFSEGILITDLSNYVQPIIRYYVSDRVRIRQPENSGDFPILEIDGRVLEPFTFCNKKFTMAFIVTKAEVWPGLLKSQIVQRGPDSLEIRGVCAPGADSEKVLGGLAEKLEQLFREQGCVSPHISYSLEPLLHNKQGGKIPRYINLEKE